MEVREFEQQVSGYKVVRELGRGATARVFSAVENETGSWAALKVFHPNIGDTPALRRRLVSEVRALQALDHPNIVRVRKELSLNSGPVLVLDYVDGQSLQEFQRQLPYVVPELSVAITIEILKAIESAHAQGVIHRDLKPSNILISNEGSVFVSDFGLAKLEGLSMSTQTGAVLGSPAYMAPEQVRGDIVTPKSDLFSVTSILYFMITGTHPFAHESNMATLAAVLEGRYEPAQRRNPKVSWALSRIIEKGFSISPSGRFATAAEYREALASYLSSLGLSPEEFHLRTWLTDPAGEALKSMKTMAEALSVQCEKRIANRDQDGAFESLSHLTLVAPSSRALVELTERVSAMRKRKAGAWMWVGWIGTLAILILSGTALLMSQRDSRPAPAAPQTQVQPPAPEVREAALLPDPATLPAPQAPARKVAPPRQSQLVRFEVPKDIEVRWNKRKLDLSRSNQVMAEPGYHELVLIKKGFPPMRQNIEVKKGEPTNIRVNP